MEPENPLNYYSISTIYSLVNPALFPIWGDDSSLEKEENQFIRALPREYILTIFRFLSLSDLCNASRVSRRWKILEKGAAFSAFIYGVIRGDAVCRKLSPNYPFQAETYSQISDEIVKGHSHYYYRSLFQSAIDGKDLSGKKKELTSSVISRFEKGAAKKCARSQLALSLQLFDAIRKGSITAESESVRSSDLCKEAADQELSEAIRYFTLVAALYDKESALLLEREKTAM